MPKKRTSAKYSNDERTNVGSDSFQEDDNAKRAKFSSIYDTTLQDLPIELLGCILVKAVAMEVMGVNVKMAKSVRKEKADLVIRRLGTVCSQWKSILTTKFFRNELNRILEGQRTIRLEILHQPSIQLSVSNLTTLKDEIFLLFCPGLLYGGGCVINVYDRNNMAQVKDVIPLSIKLPGDMAACSVSNCVYILNNARHSPSIFRITKDEEHHFKTSPWINDLKLPVNSYRGPISVSANGNLIILSRHQSPDHAHRRLFEPHTVMCKQADVGIYNANGSLQHKIRLSPDIYGFRDVHNVIQKSNGNLVLVSANDQYKAKLLEIDMIGTIVRQYQSSLSGLSVVSFADTCGRILINDSYNRIELLDSELNILEIAGPRLLEGGLGLYSSPAVHYNSERNEIVRIDTYKFNVVTGRFEATVLNIFRFTEK